MTKERIYYYLYLLNKHASFGLALSIIIFFLKMYLFHTVHAELIEAKPASEMTKGELEELRDTQAGFVLVFVIAYAACVTIASILYPFIPPSPTA